MKNDYLPYKATIISIQRESFDINTYRVILADPRVRDEFSFKQGQFAEISLLGVGEAPISITSSPSHPEFLEFTIRACGSLTYKLAQLNIGDSIYLRGPYGNSFPLPKEKNTDIYFVAGGIGLAPLRSLINIIFENRDMFGHIKILYGAKTPDEICFKRELDIWEAMPDTDVLLTVDKPDQNWEKYTGVVTELWKHTVIDGQHAIA
ncbi:MAG: FAD-binding oxidoreductase, partial [Anaerolineae bacterium]|nr:FAD-binding oxidoreductase [Anaerolineae bacterium]